MAPVSYTHLDSARETTSAFMKLNGYLDVLIPRGGAGLIRAVVENATVPVIETGVGNCHTYIDAHADLEMAVRILEDVYKRQDSRLKKIDDVLNPTAILVSDKYVKKAQDIGFSSEKILIYEKVILEAYDELMIKHALDRKLDTDPIYTLFTSGSTGTPKGVTICHRSVIDYIEWVCETFSISENDFCGNQAPLYLSLRHISRAPALRRPCP